MATRSIADGVWPTLITPFDEDDAIDLRALEALVEWYIARGVAGLFAVCQSSEMFSLSLHERLTLARAVVGFARGRVPVIASGHVSEALSEQVDEAKAMADTGVDAVVLVTNRFAGRNDGDDLFQDNLEGFLGSVPARVALGFYECPFPYKRLLSPKITALCASTGRFVFLKDTSCDLPSIEAKLEAVRGSSFKLFNANAATLLDSLLRGASGYSGVMANFHPSLYVWLVANARRQPALAERLQQFLGPASLIERQLYPVNAKYHLSLEGIPIGLRVRGVAETQLTASMRREVEQLRALARRMAEEFGVR